DSNKLQQDITNLLVNNGFYEIMTNSLTKPGYAEKASNLDAAESVNILNKLSEELGVMRQSLLYSGLEIAAYNINRKQKDLKFFEFGKNYALVAGEYKEHTSLSIFMIGKEYPEHWSKKSNDATFHDLYGAISMVLSKLGSVSIKTKTSQSYPFDYCLIISINGKEIGSFGKLKKTILKDFEIKQEIFFADLNWSLLLQLTSDNIVIEEVSKFPEVRRDLSLVLDKKVSFGDIQKVTKQSASELVREINVFDVYEGENIGENKKAYALSITLQDRNKTLTDKVIDKTMNRLIKAYENDLGALIRK
ncbi:MAG: phenylalanine--tRNA ligase subunit beta, partial [Bacteroidota bacterium]